MSCPMYKDFTRGCIEAFKDIVNISTFYVCKSDRYKECPFYRYLAEKPQFCKFFTKCAKLEFIKKLPFEQNIKLGNCYCLDVNNRVNCARYKIYDTGKDAPNDLLADGSFLEE